MGIESVVDYFEQTVRPTVNEFLSDKTNLRRARIASIVLYHMTDYFSQNGFARPLKALQGRSKMYSDTIHAAANASKHFKLNAKHIAMNANQVVVEENLGFFDAPFGAGVFAESNEVHLLLDTAQTHNGIVYESVHLPSAMTFLIEFWEFEIAKLQG